MWSGTRFLQPKEASLPPESRSMPPCFGCWGLKVSLPKLPTHPEATKEVRSLVRGSACGHQENRAMNSDAGPAECYVYIVLPGHTQAVTAGRFRLTTDRHGSTVGRFVYGRSYRKRPDAVAIDPVALKLSSRTHETVPMGGVFGVLRDAGPDSWGRRVIERHVSKAWLGELDYLLNSPDDRAGALGFGLGPQPLPYGRGSCERRICSCRTPA